MLFTKMHGCGNDYIYVNCFKEKISNPAALARKISDRHFGIGSDGLILVARSKIADAKMIMYNADGSEAEMCGNGIRCLAKYVYDHGIKKVPVIRIETRAGIKEVAVRIKNGVVISARVNMGKPNLNVVQIPVMSRKERLVLEPLKINGKCFEITTVNMGNPHCVIYIKDVSSFPVEKIGPLIETHKMFPKRTNVEFVEIISHSEVRQRTWERGSGETLACGTGASAVCVAGVLTGKTDRMLTNHLTGGTLKLEWPDDNGPVFKTGPCVEVFNGEYKI